MLAHRKHRLMINASLSVTGRGLLSLSISARFGWKIDLLLWVSPLIYHWTGWHGMLISPTVKPIKSNQTRATNKLPVAKLKINIFSTRYNVPESNLHFLTLITLIGVEQEPSKYSRLIIRISSTDEPFLESSFSITLTFNHVLSIPF